jgi:hypothetical protein
MKSKYSKIAVENLRIIIELFDSIYDEFSSSKSNVKLAEKGQDFKPANKIKNILKSEARKPMNVLKYIERNPGIFHKIYKGRYLSAVQTHQIIDTSLGLILDILCQFTENFNISENVSIARDYLYIKLTIATCDRIKRLIQQSVNDTSLSHHSCFIKICDRYISEIRTSLENIKDLSEQYNTVIELLTNKICYINPFLRENLFDIPKDNRYDPTAPPVIL